MTIFMLGKTFHWVSKARIAAWFRTAFQLPGTQDTAAAASLDGDHTPSFTPPETPAGGRRSSANLYPDNRNASAKKFFEVRSDLNSAKVK